MLSKHDPSIKQQLPLGKGHILSKHPKLLKFPFNWTQVDIFNPSIQVPLNKQQLPILKYGHWTVEQSVPKPWKKPILYY